MADLARVRAEWTGGGVTGGGVSTFHFTAGGVGMFAAVRSLFDAMRSWLDDSCTIQVVTEGDVVNDATGDIIGSWDEGPVTPVVGAGQSSFVKGVGGCIVWTTGARRNNRLVRGRTFIAPVTTQPFGTDGLLTGAFTGELIGAGNALMNSATNELRVWSRPHAGAADGSSHVVTGVTCSSTPAWLSSRKR